MLILPRRCQYNSLIHRTNWFLGVYGHIVTGCSFLNGWGSMRSIIWWISLVAISLRFHYSRGVYGISAWAGQIMEASRYAKAMLILKDAPMHRAIRVRVVTRLSSIARAQSAHVIFELQKWWWMLFVQSARDPAWVYSIVGIDPQHSIWVPGLTGLTNWEDGVHRDRMKILRLAIKSV